MYIVGSVSTVTDSYHSLIIQEGHMKTGVDHQIITEPRDIQIIVAVDPIPHHKATALDQGLQAAVVEVVVQGDVNF